MFLEHIKVELPELKELDRQIDEAYQVVRSLEQQRDNVIDAQAQKIAVYKEGDEFETHKARYRITKVRGDYHPYKSDGLQLPSMIWVRYIGRKLFKKGTESADETVYPPEPIEEQPNGQQR